MNNNPPFKVVCIGNEGNNSKNLYEIELGEIVTVESYSKAENRNGLHYHLKEYPISKRGRIAGYWAKNFAPIETQYLDIRKEIADSAGETRETPDKVLSPEKVMN